VVPEGWEKEEIEEYAKLTKKQQNTYNEMRPTIGLNNSVGNWKKVMATAKETGNVRRAVTPIRLTPKNPKKRGLKARPPPVNPFSQNVAPNTSLPGTPQNGGSKGKGRSVTPIGKRMNISLKKSKTSKKSKKSRKSKA
jgi:hypothetical protein